MNRRLHTEVSLPRRATSARMAHQHPVFYGEDRGHSLQADRRESSMPDRRRASRTDRRRHNERARTMADVESEYHDDIEPPLTPAE